MEITLRNGIVRPLPEVPPAAGAQMPEEIEQKVVRRKTSMFCG